MLSQIKQNPGAILGKRFRQLPQNMSSSEDLIQYFLDTGQLSQDQLNRAVMQAQNNPMLQQMNHMMNQSRR